MASFDKVLRIPID